VRLLRSPFLLVLAATFIRVAGLVFDVLDIDEVDFALIGRSVAEGHLPYVQLVDIKPPLTYVAFAPAAWFGRLSLLPMHVLGILVTCATALILGRAAYRWTHDELVAAVAPWLYLLATLCDVPSVNSELLLNLPTAAALYCFAGESMFLAGVWLGVASLFKHQGGMPLAPFGLVLFWRALRTRDARPIWSAVAMTLGLLVPWALTVLAYVRHLPEFWDWCFARNFGYVGEAGSTEPALPRFLLSTATCIGGTLVPWLLSLRETFSRSPRAREPLRAALLAGLWLTWIPVAMGGRFYEHYYLQFAPFLTLVAAPRAADWLDAWPRLSRAVRVRALALTVLPVVAACAFFSVKGVVHGYQAQDPKLREVARFLRGETRPDEELFVWGHSSPLYYLADRRPGTRYFHCSVHVGNFDPGHLPEGFDPRKHVSERDVAATLQDLEAHRVALFADLAPAAIHHWEKLPLSAVPALDAYLHDHYDLIGEPSGARVYRRRK
jgi:hypothetical protein